MSSRLLGRGEQPGDAKWILRCGDLASSRRRVRAVPTDAALLRVAWQAAHMYPLMSSIAMRVHSIRRKGRASAGRWCCPAGPCLPTRRPAKRPKLLSFRESKGRCCRKAAKGSASADPFAGQAERLSFRQGPAATVSAMPNSRAKERDPVVTSRIMATVRGHDTRPEVLLRSLLHRRGLRFRKQYRLPGKPDIVFPRARVAVFVDGDFWHGNTWRIRGFASFEDQFQHRNSDWWRAKIERNMQRDREVTQLLRREGWRVVRVWESALLRDPSRIAERVERSVRG